MKSAGELLDILRRPNASLPVDPRRPEQYSKSPAPRLVSPVGVADRKVPWMAIARIGGLSMESRRDTVTNGISGSDHASPETGEERATTVANGKDSPPQETEVDQVLQSPIYKLAEHLRPRLTSQPTPLSLLGRPRCLARRPDLPAGRIRSSERRPAYPNDSPQRPFVPASPPDPGWTARPRPAHCASSPRATAIQAVSARCWQRSRAVSTGNCPRGSVVRRRSDR